MGVQQWQARVTLGKAWQWHNWCTTVQARPHWQSVAGGVAGVATIIGVEYD